MPLLYLHYLDNIFGIWVSAVDSFKEFINVLNSHHPEIKLKYNLQHDKVEFLDTTVFFHNHTEHKKGLATKAYFKDTDRHLFFTKQAIIQNTPLEV